jgi:hypothetical protein
MSRPVVLCLPLLLAASLAAADEGARTAGAAAPTEKPSVAQSDVKMSGMSILGNDEAPKSLVLVPWKSSQLGEMPALSRLPDDSIKPVDKDVFVRELGYYEIRSASN